MSQTLNKEVNKKSQKGFIKNGIVFALLFLIIASLFWLTHLTTLDSTALFFMFFLLFIGLTFFALRFLVFPFFFPDDESLMEKSQLFQSEESLNDFRLKEGYVNLNYMKGKFMFIVNKFKKFYYGGLFSNEEINTEISKDVSSREFTESVKVTGMETVSAEDEGKDILDEFEVVSKEFEDEKEATRIGKASIVEDKKEIEESIEFQREYIESVREEKDKIAGFLQEQKEDLADLLVQKEKEEVELASLAAIENRVSGKLQLERGELKKLLASSKKELAVINIKRRETLAAIQRNRNEAARKADFIKQVQQRRMALASIKKEKLQALNS